MTHDSYEYIVTEHYRQKIDADFLCEINVRNLPLPKKEFEILTEDILVFCRQGKLKVWAGGKECNKKKGEFMYFAYDEPSKMVSSSVDFRCDYMQVSRKLAHEITSRFPLEYRTYFIKNPIAKLSDETADLVQSYMSILNRRMEYRSAQDYKKAVLLSILTSFAMDMFALIHIDTINLAPLKITREGVINALKQELTDENVRTNRKVIFYARKLAMSPGYLNKIVQEELHTSVKTILDDMVIGYIKEDVRRGDITIKGLSIKYGFSSTAHLSSFFKKIVGMTPLDYYRRYHNATEEEIEEERRKMRERMQQNVDARKVGRPSKYDISISQGSALEDITTRRRPGRPRKNKN